MNRSARRKRATRAEHEAELATQVKAKDALLDMVNLLLTREGGRIVIPATEVEAATRHHIDIKVEPPDPEVAGSETMYVITLEGYTPPPPAPMGVKDRMKAAGIWLP